MERPRVEDALAALIERHRVVVVSATSGAGKTTAVAAAVRTLTGPVAWLTLDWTDAAAGRLVRYLEAALGAQLPAVASVASDALAARIPHAEAVGLLVEAIGDERVVLVVDELERLGEGADAWPLLHALVRYAPPGMRIVLISRRELPPAMLAERRRHLAELATDARYEAAELAFAEGRLDEARQLVEAVLRAEPYREPAFRLTMRLAGALGDEDGVIRAFQRCERELEAVGAVPTQTTRQLLTRLRR